MKKSAPMTALEKLTRALIAVPKEEIEARERAYERAKKQRKPRKRKRV